MTVEDLIGDVVLSSKKVSVFTVIVFVSGRKLILTDIRTVVTHQNSLEVV